AYDLASVRGIEVVLRELDVVGAAHDRDRASQEPVALLVDPPDTGVRIVIRPEDPPCVFSLVVAVGFAKLERAEQESRLVVQADVGSSRELRGRARIDRKNDRDGEDRAGSEPRSLEDGFEIVLLEESAEWAVRPARQKLEVRSLRAAELESGPARRFPRDLLRFCGGSPSLDERAAVRIDQV